MQPVTISLLLVLLVAAVGFYLGVIFGRYQAWREYQIRLNALTDKFELKLDKTYKDDEVVDELRARRFLGMPKDGEG